jgi:hypothetical protein
MIMKLSSISTLLLPIILVFGCSSDDEQLNISCDENDHEIFVNNWSDPEFIASGDSCYLDECIQIDFQLNADSTYGLRYTIYDTQTNQVLRTLDDQGNYLLSCVEKGRLSGRYSALQYVKSELELRSDSLTPVQWNLEYNGIEGLIIKQEYLGFTHSAYLMLR